MAMLAVAGVIAAIWWLEYRPQGGEEAPSGFFGMVDLPQELVLPGMRVEAQEGSLAPDFLLPTLDGGQVRLSELRGHPVVLNFWATWCAPCRKEVPQLVAAYDRHRPAGLVIIAVNLQEPEDRVRRFAEEFQMKFPVALDKTGQVTLGYQVWGLPTTFFIDRQGVVRSIFQGPFVGEGEEGKVQGPIGGEELERRIAEILE